MAKSKATPAAPVRRRRSSEQTRELMLRAGAELAFAYSEAASDEAVSAVLAHIRLTDVAAKASELDPTGGSVTTGALYQLWSSQADYQADLLFHVIGLASLPVGTTAFDHGLRQLAAGIEPEHVLMEVIDLDYRLAREVPAVYVDWSSYLVASNPRVREALRESYGSLDERVLTFYELLLRMDKRRMRAPFTVHHLSAGMTTLIEGSMLRRRVEPEQMPDSDEWPDGDRGTGRSLTGEAAVGVYRAFTEPLEED